MSLCSAAAVQREMLACYELIESIGRGVVYYGSARLKADNPHFVKSRESQLHRPVAHAHVGSASRLEFGARVAT